MRREHYGVTQDERNVDIFILDNNAGMRVAILSFGGVITELKVPDHEGNLANVVLNAPSLSDYEHRSPFFGAIIGRYANRIAKGHFNIDGKDYQLELNDGGNALHGGRHGFDKTVWEPEEGDGETLILRHASPNGDAGYPGNLTVEVRYSLDSNNELRIDYQASSDRPTIINLTNHSYFNLSGRHSGDVLNHVLTIHADHFLPTDSRQVPTGEFRSVRGSPFDFIKPTVIGERISGDDEQLRIAGGYDHNWVPRSAGGDLLREVARVYEPVSRRVLEIVTDAPGLQFYSGNNLGGDMVDPAGWEYRRRAGFCLETQRFPDAPNQPKFPSALLRPGEKFQSTTIMRFSTD